MVGSKVRRIRGNPQLQNGSAVGNRTKLQLCEHIGLSQYATNFYEYFSPQITGTVPNLETIILKTLQTNLNNVHIPNSAQIVHL